MDPRLRFLMALTSAIRNGAVKTIKQAMAFAKREFGEIDKDFTNKIINVFKKEGKTKKGDVVPIKKKEGIMATDEATKIAKKRTDDIATGDPTGETSEIMEGLEKKINKIKKSADDLTDNPFADFESYVLGGKGLDPRKAMVRTAAREILNKNKIKIGKEDPIDVLRKTYGEAGLEAVDNISDDLLNTQTYGEVDDLLTKNKLFDLKAKKTPGYDESVVAGEKIRKAMEQEAKNKQILDDFDIDPDRQPNAYGGIAGTLRLNRTGYVVGSGPKVINLIAKHGPEFKKFVDMLFIKASNTIRQGKGIFKNLDESQRIKQHDNLTQEVTKYQKTGELDEAVHQYFGMNPEVAYAETLQKVSAGPGKSINISDDAVAADFTKFIKETDPEGYKK